jgi:hypothetical protein
MQPYEIGMTIIYDVVTKSTFIDFPWGVPLSDRAVLVSKRGYCGWRSKVPSTGLEK